MYNFRTDLALERRDLYRSANNIENEIDGIETEREENGENIITTRVKVTNEKGEQAIGKPIGTYVTIDIKNLKIAGNEDIQKGADIVSKELKALIDKHTDKEGDILVVGLGNVYVTPDSLRTKSC